MSGQPAALESELLFICRLILSLFYKFLKQSNSFWINSRKQYNRYLLSMLLVLLYLPVSTRSREKIIQKLVQNLRKDDQITSILCLDIDFPHLKLFHRLVLNFVRNLWAAATKTFSLPGSPTFFLETPPIHLTHSKYYLQTKVWFFFDLLTLS